MSTFKVGQRVVCLNKYNSWISYITGVTTDGPMIDEVTTVSGFDNDPKYPGLFFTEYCSKEGYWEGLFRPLLDSALEEQVDELEEQTVEA